MFGLIQTIDGGNRREEAKGLRLVSWLDGKSCVAAK